MRICVPLAVLVLWLVPVLDCHARIAILTTFAPVHCFTSNVAGDAADVSVLVPPNAGPHDYAFSPADLQKIAKADVLIMSGAGLENWLQRGIRSAGRKNLLVVDTSAGIKLITGLDVQPLPDAYIARLKELDTQIRRAAASFPNKNLITFSRYISLFCAGLWFQCCRYV